MDGDRSHGGIFPHSCLGQALSPLGSMQVPMLPCSPAVSRTRCSARSISIFTFFLPEKQYFHFWGMPWPSLPSSACGRWARSCLLSILFSPCLPLEQTRAPQEMYCDLQSPGGGAACAGPRPVLAPAWCPSAPPGLALARPLLCVCCALCACCMPGRDACRAPAPFQQAVWPPTPPEARRGEAWGASPALFPKPRSLGWLRWGDREDGVAPSRWSRALVRSPGAPVWVLIWGEVWGEPDQEHGSCLAGPVGAGSQRCLLGWWWGATGTSVMVLVLLVPAQTICGAWARPVSVRLRCLAVRNERFWSPVAAKLLQQGLQHQEGAQVGLVLLGHRGDRHAGLVCPVLPQAAARLHGDRLALHQVLHVLLRGHRHG